MITSIVLSAGVMLLLTWVVSGALTLANDRLAVHVDPRQQELDDLLPQANCGGCGFPSCAAYAKAIHRGAASVNLCSVGGPDVARQLARVMGVTAEVNYPYRPVIHCTATRTQRLRHGDYLSVTACSAAQTVGGVQGCSYGCLGFGDCVESCDYAAMTLIDGLPRINYDNCVGCGACVRACPRNLIEQVPFKTDRMLVVGCASHDPGKTVREVCQVGCIGCGLCSRNLPQLFDIEDGLARIDYENYRATEDFGPIMEKCPTESLVMFGKPLARHEDELSDVNARDRADRPEPPERPTQEDVNWRG